MTKSYMTMFLVFLASAVFGQLTNSGGTIVIQSGAKLVVEGDVTNEGNINNSGDLEIDGNFNTASGTLAANDGTIKLYGGSASAITAGSNSINNLVLDKNSGLSVTLADDLSLTGALSFNKDGNFLAIGDNNLTLQNTASINKPSNFLSYIMTNGTGSVIKNGINASSFDYPVGYNNQTYNPISISKGGTAADISVRVMEDADGLTENVVDAAWVVSGGDDLNVEVSWTAQDETTGFDRTDCGVSKKSGSTFDLLWQGADAATVDGSTYSRARSGLEQGTFVVGGEGVMNYVQVEARVFLGGAYNTSTNNMNDGLRSASLIPTIDPYDQAPYALTHEARGAKSPDVTTAQLAVTGNDAIVDWMWMELRNKTNNTEVLATKSVFVQRDGDVVEADGMPVKFYGMSADDYYVVLNHRNHLGIMTDAIQPLSTSSTLLDFTDGSTATEGSNAQTLLDSGPNVYGLWPGDVTGDKAVKFQGVANDVSAQRSNIINYPGNPFKSLSFLYSDYSVFDINLDSQIKFQGVNNEIDFMRGLVINHPGNPFSTLSYVITQQIPE